MNMRALTATEIRILDQYSIPSSVVFVTGYAPTLQNIKMAIAFQSSRPAQTITLPKSEARYKQICNPQRNVIMSNIFAHESPVDSNGIPKLFTTGYVPPNSPLSGLTIGYGIDVGALGTSSQTIAAQLTTWGISADGLLTLTPYFTLVGSNATAALTLLGAPTISKVDAQTISKNAIQSYSDHAASQFNTLNPNLVFNQIPANGQTALTDIAFWKWSFTAAIIPTGFTDALAQGDFTTAGQLLISTGNQRLIDDGKLLQSCQAQIPKAGQNIACGSIGP